MPVNTNINDTTFETICIEIVPFKFVNTIFFFFVCYKSELELLKSIEFPIWFFFVSFVKDAYAHDKTARQHCFTSMFSFFVLNYTLFHCFFFWTKTIAKRFHSWQQTVLSKACWCNAKDTRKFVICFVGWMSCSSIFFFLFMFMFVYINRFEWMPEWMNRTLLTDAASKARYTTNEKKKYKINKTKCTGSLFLLYSYASGCFWLLNEQEEKK